MQRRDFIKAVTTDASNSFTATAKDFVLGDFNVCSVDVSKTCENDDKTDDIPTAITFNLRGCGFNDGGGAIKLTGLDNTINADAETTETPSDLAWYEPGQVGEPLREFNPITDCEDAKLLLQAIDNGTTIIDP